MKSMKVKVRAILLAAAFILTFCASCGKSKKQNEVVYEHKHTYSTVWSGNEWEHWKNATCKHNVTANLGPHNFTDGGKTCTVCGYTVVDKTEDKEEKPIETPDDKPAEQPEEKPQDKPDEQPVPDPQEPEEEKPDDEKPGEGGDITPDEPAIPDEKDPPKEPDSGDVKPDTDNPKPDEGDGENIGDKDDNEDNENNQDNEENNGEENGGEVSPFVSIRLKAGKTEQVVSKTDKISKSWLFEAVRENGEAEDVSAEEVIVNALKTDEVGNFVAEIKWGSLTGEAEYCILPVPERVTDFAVSPIEIVRETEEESVTFTADDFAVSASVAGSYTLAVRLEADGFATDGFVCPSDGSERRFYVVAEYSFTVEDEERTKVFRSEIAVRVNKKAVEPDDGDFAVNEGGFADWVPTMLDSTVKTGNLSVEIELAPQEFFAVGCADGALVIADNSEDYGYVYSGLTFNLKKNARVTLIACALNADSALVGVDDFYEISSEKTELVFDLTEGAHSLTFIANPAAKIIITGISVTFGD